MQRYQQPPNGDDRLTGMQVPGDTSGRPQKVLRKPVPGRVSSQQSGVIQNVQSAGPSRGPPPQQAQGRSHQPSAQQPQGRQYESPLPPPPREGEPLSAKQRYADPPAPVPVTARDNGPAPEKQPYVNPSSYIDQVAADEEFARQLERMEMEDQAPPLPGKRPMMIDTSTPGRITDSAVYASPARTDSGTTGASSQTISSNGFSNSTAVTSPTTTLTSPGSSQEQPGESKFKGFMKDALGEARHLAGHLVAHPSESTKHYSILRHSTGLVFYQGTSTTVPISIFSDGALPSDRSIWLQSKGWTGKAGMKFKTLVGHTGYWLDVTPQTAVTAAQLNPTDERAYQRDIKHFYKHAEKSARKHRLRETCIIRIPAEAEDGYFRLVLCTGTNKKVLCSSPEFRVLSTSTSPSSIKGASLSTLPLELGAKVATMTANAMASNAISPVTNAISTATQPYRPGFVTQTAAQAAYNVSGTAGRVDNTIEDANSRYDARRDVLYSPTAADEAVVDAGPQPPYPIIFTGRVEKGTGANQERFGMPTANLAGVPESVALRLKGYYFGWARVAPPKRSQTTQSSSSKASATPASSGPGEIQASNPNPWYEAVISSLPLDITTLQRVKISHTTHQIIGVYLIYDLSAENISLLNLILEVRILGFIRPPNPPRAMSPTSPRSQEEADRIIEEEMLAAVNDVTIAQRCLASPAWGPDPLRPAERTQSNMDRVKEGYASSRMYAQRQIDKVPLHRAGVRMPVDAMRSRAVGSGGIYVVR